MKDIPEGDGYVSDVLKKAVKSLEGKIDYLVVSIDLDAFDPNYVPAVGSPVADGFNIKEVLEGLRDMKAVRAPDMLEIVEYNPSLGGAMATYSLLREIIEIVLKD